ncbi:MAG: YbhB/YbcL family Raf kinase inhibitor-like protein [Candidatus Dadabacteria bacterium]|nr:MAG: YbhB/YbcL family Raf kinase inhibitor-like protein [Candidatus Dadabacteria bacterium]
MKNICTLGFLIACFALNSFAQERAKEPTNMKLASPAFKMNQRIPIQYSGTGKDISPALHWSDAPDNVREFALIVDDPDAPGKTPWVHWVVYKIPASLNNLPEDLAGNKKSPELASILEGKNSWGTIGYRGPLPPPGHGVHHYHFKLYALREPLKVSSGLSAAELTAHMQGLILAEAELIGTFER